MKQAIRWLLCPDLSVGQAVELKRALGGVVAAAAEMISLSGFPRPFSERTKKIPQKRLRSSARLFSPPACLTGSQPHSLPISLGCHLRLDVASSQAEAISAFGLGGSDIFPQFIATP